MVEVVQFLQRLHILVQSKTSALEIQHLLRSLTFMIESSPELRLEEKIMVLCGVPTHSAKTPMTVAQASSCGSSPRRWPLSCSARSSTTRFSQPWSSS